MKKKKEIKEIKSARLVFDSKFIQDRFHKLIGDDSTFQLPDYVLNSLKILEEEKIHYSRK